LGRFYLGIAEDSLKRLEHLAEPLDGGGVTFPEPTYRLTYRRHSPHFEHALICSAFSAFAVEYEATRLAVWRTRFQIPVAGQPSPSKVIPERPPWKQVVACLREVTEVPGPIIRKMDKLMMYRHSIVHTRMVLPPDIEVRPALLPGQKRELVRRIRTPRITCRNVVLAPRHFANAVEAVEALRKETGSDKWRVGLPSIPEPSRRSSSRS
jgi:hypothetical protein